MSEEPIKIVIKEDEAAPFVPENPESSVSGRAVGATRSAVDAGQRAWNSPRRQQLASAVNKGVTTAARRGVGFVRETAAPAAEKGASTAVTTVRRQVRQGRWRGSLAGGLAWLSERLASVADRLTPSKHP